MAKKKYLNDGWKFKSFKLNSTPADISTKLKSWQNANVPGTVHTDLLDARIINDPYYADNELYLKWISLSDWVYLTKFDLPSELIKSDKILLVFEGLDTIAEVFLNNQLVLKSQNMFMKYDIEVSEYLKQKSNVLKIIFYSPVKQAKKFETKYGKLPVELESSRVYLRKAQYSFGWDWGPVFPTTGIWQSVYLKQKETVEIEDIVFRTAAIVQNKAELECDFKINKAGRESCSYIIELYYSNVLVKTVEAKVSGNSAAIKFELDEPKLWWPNGHGKQKIYNLNIKLFNKNKLAASKEIKVGIRTVELIQKENETNTFKFKINNKDIFINGTNWIPTDSFLPRVTKNKIGKLLSLAKEANVNLVRVWGGGIYESEEFYETCDSLGLLVWQDFMFACAVYPTDKEFLESVKNEAEQNIYRLCNHPALILWCGNNENEWIWYRQYSKDISEMPDYKIYHKLLPQIINDIKPSQEYWPSSPFGSDEDPNSELSGNRHQWDIWSFWKDYTEVKNDKSLFVTEFGFQAPANVSTFEKVIPKKSRTSQSKLFEFHNKQIEGPERLFKFLSAHFPVKLDWGDFIYLTQLNQGMALKTMIEHWRTNSVTNGCIIWQLNDCWPVSSWSIIDYDIKPKLSYYFVKSAFQSELLYFQKSSKKVVLNLNNGNLKHELRKVKIYLWDYKSNETENIIINLNSKKRISNGIIDFYEEDLENKIVVCSLFDKNDEMISRTVLACEEWKYIKLPVAELKAEVVITGAESYIEVSSTSLTLFIYLTHPDYIFLINGFNLLPGERIKINLIKTGKSEFRKTDMKMYCLNDYLESR